MKRRALKKRYGRATLRGKYPLNAYEKGKIKLARITLNSPSATHLEKSDAQFILDVLGVKR